MVVVFACTSSDAIMESALWKSELVTESLGQSQIWLKRRGQWNQVASSTSTRAWPVPAICASPGSKSSAGMTRLKLQALEPVPAVDGPVPVCTKDFRAVWLGPAVLKNYYVYIQACF